MSVSWVKVASMALLFLFAPTLAMAHGDNPVPRRVYTFAKDGGWLMATSFGVITSDAPRHYVCEEAFLGSDAFLVMPRSTTTWTAISENRIAVTTDGGCSFDVRSGRLDGVPVAAASSPDGVVQAFILGDRLHWSEDLWQTRGEVVIEPLEQVQWTGMDFGSGGALFVVGYSREEATRGSARLLELDLGPLRRGEASPGVTRHENVSGATYPYLFDVQAGRLAGIASVEGELSLLWNTPGEWLTGRLGLSSWPVDVAASPDGRRVAAAGAAMAGEAVVYWYEEARGVWTGEQVVSEGEGSACVAWSEDSAELLHCARASTQATSLGKVRVANELGEGALGGEEALVRFSELEGPRDQSCGGEREVVKTCKVVWPSLARALRIELPGGGASEEMGSSLEGEEMGGGEDMSSSPMDEEEEMSGGEGISSSNDNEGGCAVSGSSFGGDDILIVLCLLGFFGFRVRVQARRRTR